jgi:acyl-[acyl-carrier-protein] desaturase
VFAHFKMPGVDLVPDYDARILKMREAGIDRSVFIQKVYMPILKYLGVGRHEMLGAQRAALDARHASKAESAAAEAPAGAESDALHITPMADRSREKMAAVGEAQAAN